MDEFPNEPVRRCVAAFDLVTAVHSQIHHPIDLLHHIAATGTLRFEWQDENIHGKRREKKKDKEKKKKNKEK